MAATTSTGRGKASPAKGGAARAATSEKKHKTIKAGGLTFKIPPVMPGIVLLHFGEIEGGKVLAPVQGIIRDVIGETQFELLVDKIRTLDADATGDLLGEVAGKITDAYGLTAGK
jgi:hypothetical protein